MNVSYVVRFEGRSDSTIDVTEPQSEEYNSSVREAQTREREDEETGDAITKGTYPFESEDVALDYFETLVDDLEDANSFEASVRLTPLGGVHTDEVQEWYQENSEEIPEDYDEDNSPQTWDSSRHIIAEKRE